MEKIVYLVWASKDVARDRGATRDLLVDRCAPRLLALSPASLVAYVNDPESRMSPPMPFGPRTPPPISGTVEIGLESLEERGPFEEVLRGAGFTIAGYHVEESIYREYGGNRHAGPRTWADGQRSPGVCVVTLLERPKRLEPEEWVRRWHGVMSPVSEEIQPRTRYVRNRVIKALTPGAPAIDGIVAEMWPSVRHVKNPFLFFGAKNPIALAVNVARILRALAHFHDPMRVRTYPSGEYLLKTDFRAPAPRA